MEIASIIASALLYVFVGADLSLPPATTEKIDFARDINPILIKNCVGCHGPKKQSGGLRLDSRTAAIEGGDSGPIFETGKSADAELIHRVAGLDEKKLMPPKGKGERLTPREIGLVRAWIDQGAEWSKTETAESSAPKSDHWSFRAIQTPSLPSVKKTGWVRNPIDRFILAKLESNQFAPSAEADRATLLRRVSLDLTGLPPSPDRVTEFLRDDRFDAYERLVDELLSSPHFGERWGRHWLDLARYADSDGYEKDLPREHAWRYRHWVIDSINRDQPFDQFTIEQLAGDLLPNATVEQRVATGFHRNTLTNREGGVDQEEYRVRAVIDRVNTTGAVWLGITINCCQCHTHKYDPITQREYYGMFAFFDNADEADIPAPHAEEVTAHRQALAAFEREEKELERRIAAAAKDIAVRQVAWEESARKNETLKSWNVLEPAGALSEGGATLAVQKDGSIQASGVSPATDAYTVVVNTKLKGITSVRLEVLPSPELPKTGPGRADNGNFVLSEFTVSAAPLGDSSKSQKAAIGTLSADASQNGFPIAHAIDGKKETGWAIDVGGNINQRRTAVFHFKQPLGGDQGTTLTFTLGQYHSTIPQHTLGRFRLSATDVVKEDIDKLIPEGVLAALHSEPSQRNAEQKQLLASHYRTIDSELSKLDAEMASLKKRRPREPQTKAQALAERGADRRTTRLMVRGDFLNPAGTVEPLVPAVLHPIAKPVEKTPGRLDLAKWIVAPANPLTARVTVNRMWGHLFGKGIVVTTDDFGTRGDPPSHPELLDWLAGEFVRSGWSRKAILRTMVTSATYRQSSKTRPELWEKDPANVLLGRQNRLRVEAEVVRDEQLYCSGLLDFEVGGKSVRPRLPDGVADLGYAGSVKWPMSEGGDRYRRGLYVFMQRTVPYPMLSMFDAPDSNLTCPRRERSNTPLQSLTLLNDPVFFECSQAFARRLLRETDPAANVEVRVRHAFTTSLGRLPESDEVVRLAALHREQQRLAEADLAAAAKIVGEPTPPGASLADAAAWVIVGRVLMNLDEFVTRE